MKTRELRTISMALSTAALFISAFALGRSEPGEQLLGVIGGEAVYFGIAALASVVLALTLWVSQGLLAGILILLHLPGIASHSSLDWANIAGWTDILPDPHVSPWTTAFLVLATAVLYTLAVRAALEISYRSFNEGDLDETDRARYVSRSVATLVRVLGGSTVVSLIAIGMAYAISSSLFRDGLALFPVMLLGIATVMIVAFVVYSLRLSWADLVMEDAPRPARSDRQRAEAGLADLMAKLERGAGVQEDGEISETSRL